ncbi:MAG: hypothetical protein RR639_05445 [Hydrogenoanaerobacterium sp.]
MTHRAHPVMIIEFLWGFVYLLIIPLLRGVITALHSGFSGWLSGAWVDILVLCLIIALAVAQWRCLSYRCLPDGVLFRQGIIRHSKSYISHEHIDTLAVTCPYYLKPFGAVRLRADTKAGRFDKADVNITIYKRDADEIFASREKKLNAEKAVPERKYTPKGIYIVALSALLSNSFAGVIFFSTFISRTGKLLGKGFESLLFVRLKSFTRLVTFGIPPIAAVIAYILLFGWLFTFILNLFRHNDFCVQRNSGTLEITGGLFTNRKYSVDVREINYIDIRQSILTKLLGLYSVFVQAIGYGKEKDDVSAIIPASVKDELTNSLALLLPEFKPAKRQAKPNAGAIMRFIADTLFGCILLPSTTIILMLLLPKFSDIIGWVGFMACIPAYLFLLVRIMDFTSSGIGRTGDIYTLKYSQGFHLHTIIMPLNKVASITLRQSVFQKMDNKCDILLFSISEKRRRHHIRNIDKTMAIQILHLQPQER